LGFHRAWGGEAKLSLFWQSPVEDNMAPIGDNLVPIEDNVVPFEDNLVPIEDI